MKPNYSAFKDDWNLNKGFLDEIARMINQVNLCSAAGNVREWFNNLRTLFRNAAPFLAKKSGCLDEHEIDALFQAIKNEMPRLPKNENEQRYYDVKMGKVTVMVDELNIELIRSMHANRLIMPMARDDYSKAALEFN